VPPTVQERPAIEFSPQLGSYFDLQTFALCKLQLEGGLQSEFFLSMGAEFGSLQLKSNLKPSLCVKFGLQI
jgi:hypothetical protein